MVSEKLQFSERQSYRNVHRHTKKNKKKQKTGSQIYILLAIIILVPEFQMFKRVSKLV